MVEKSHSISSTSKSVVVVKRVWCLRNHIILKFIAKHTNVFVQFVSQNFVENPRQNDKDNSSHNWSKNCLRNQFSFLHFSCFCHTYDKTNDKERKTGVRCSLFFLFKKCCFFTATQHLKLKHISKCE